LVEYKHPIRIDIDSSRKPDVSPSNEGTLTLKFQVLDRDSNGERTATFSKFRFESSSIHVLDSLGCTDNQFAYAVFTSIRFVTKDHTLLDLNADYKDERGMAIPPADLVIGLSKAKHNTHNWDRTRDNHFNIRLTVESYPCPFVTPNSWIVEDSFRTTDQRSKRDGKRPRQKKPTLERSD